MPLRNPGGGFRSLESIANYGIMREGNRGREMEMKCIPEKSISVPAFKSRKDYKDLSPTAIKVDC